MPWFSHQFYVKMRLYPLKIRIKNRIWWYLFVFASWSQKSFIISFIISWFHQFTSFIFYVRSIFVKILRILTVKQIQNKSGQQPKSDTKGNWSDSCCELQTSLVEEWSMTAQNWIICSTKLSGDSWIESILIGCHDNCTYDSSKNSRNSMKIVDTASIIYLQFSL